MHERMFPESFPQGNIEVMSYSSLVLELLQPVLFIQRSVDPKSSIFGDYLTLDITVKPCQAISNYASANMRLWAKSKEIFKCAINDAVIARLADTHRNIEIVSNHIDPYGSECEITLRNNNTDEMAIFIFELKIIDEGLTHERS